ncbi:glycosyltransferase family 4 protein [Microbulbifer sp. 2205BS26-8]|uniref:glycosyltransferase family 4 protein n=1 Tax=Microbulbifer sp. 2205BS26-8 TaxID=3064386 RepID=UPI00273E9E27|nr:glycosyltransferase family 4 protein [Microbulbifer sp. 2205BS26-8]MDP5210500.1 glycosyltransferase family 4 protein [Microbulbifer sp. 2205BS26-8]
MEVISDSELDILGRKLADKISQDLSKNFYAKVALLADKLRESEADLFLAREKLQYLEEIKEEHALVAKKLEKREAEFPLLVEKIANLKLVEQEFLIASSSLKETQKKYNLVCEDIKIFGDIKEKLSDALRVNQNIAQEASRLARSVEFRLGQTILACRHSIWGLLKLPHMIWSLKRQIKKENMADKSLNKQEKEEFSIFELCNINAKAGVNAAESYLNKVCQSRVDFAKGLTELARLALHDDVKKAAELARNAITTDPAIFRLRWFASFIFDTGCINEAFDTLASLPNSEQEKLRIKSNQIKGAYKLKNLKELGLNCSSYTKYKSVDRRILYMASSVLPYHVTGYTTRTQNILTSILKKGWNVKCITCPGYPNDRPDANNSDLGSEYILDGVQYTLLDGKHRWEVDSEDYIFQSAERIIQEIEKFRPVAVHAASNYEAALPTLIAARRLGVPFYYEVRGLWEYTAASKWRGWENTERFILDRALESLTAKHADGVFTLTNALANELTNRGVAKNKIKLLPNGVDLTKFKRCSYNKLLGECLSLSQDDFVVGYIGSLVDYEGLDCLLIAFSLLKKLVPHSKLVVIGGGAILEDLKSQAYCLSISNEVRFVGRVKYDVVQEYFSLLDVIALPRKDMKVCQLVSPLKPLEAMAMRVPLVVSNVDALSEMLVDEQTGLIHKSEDSNDLCKCLVRVATEDGLGVRLSENAYHYVRERRKWDQIVQVVSDSYKRHLEI